MMICEALSTEASIGSPSWQVGNSQHRGNGEPRCGGGSRASVAGAAFCTRGTEEALS